MPFGRAVSAPLQLRIEPSRTEPICPMKPEAHLPAAQILP